MTLLLVILAFVTTVAYSQNRSKAKTEQQHKVVMQVTEGDSLTQLAVIGQVKNIKKQLPDARIEIVCHANALDLLLKSGSKVTSHFSALRAMDVQFMACENTMARKKVTASDLVPEAGTVPSGLVEIILKQEAGWSYIKGGH